MFTKIIGLAIFMTISTGVFSQTSCPDNKDVNKVAKALIEIEMSGIRLISGAKEKCLNSKYKQYKFNSDPNRDEPKNVEYFIESSKDIRVLSVDIVDKDVYQYEASYTANVVDPKGSKKVIKDKIGFYLNTSEKAIKVDGCAAVISPPKTLVLLKSCIKK